MALGSGDFEAVGYPAIPAAPRVPSFNRSVASPQAGFGYPAHYVPPAAHSLSPVAMSAVADAASTGPQRAQPVVVRSRPNARTGMAIIAAGVLIGAVFGIGVRVRDAGAAATFAAEQSPAVEQEAPVETQPVPSPVAPVVVASSGAVTAPAAPSAQAPAQNYAGVPFGSLVVTPPPAPAAEAPKPRAKRSWGKPAAAPRVAAKAKATAPKATAPKAKDKDDGYTVASAGNDAPKPSKASKKADKPEKTEKVDKAEKVEKASKPAKPRKGMDEADRLLKEAMGATENTL